MSKPTIYAVILSVRDEGLSPDIYLWDSYEAARKDFTNTLNDLKPQYDHHQFIDDDSITLTNETSTEPDVLLEIQTLKLN